MVDDISNQNYQTKVFNFLNLTVEISLYRTQRVLEGHELVFKAMDQPDHVTKFL